MDTKGGPAWFFEAYFETEHGVGWDECGGPYNTMEEANEQAKTFKERYEEVTKTSVYPELD